MIEMMRVKYSIGELCVALKASRSGYYAWRGRRPGVRARSNEVLLEKIHGIHAHRHTRCYGSPRMTRELHDHGLSCSENRVARLMARAGLRARPRRPFRPKTTQPDHAARPSPNLLAKAGSPSRPGEQIVSDITYIRTNEGWLYLVVVLDLFSRAVLGWDLSDSLDSGGVASALRRALKSNLIPPEAIFHSDRGCQYSAREVRALLAQPRFKQSMSAKGYCYDNAFAESFFASAKTEMLPDVGFFETHLDARRAIFDYLETFYNRRRRHSSLNYLSPEKFLALYFEQPSIHRN